uniref:Putative group i salivary lipocalin n=1 Tax=Rhipicephalus pulchellus TaxID=72859 RepID=L7LT89_RHIPC
MSRPAFILFLLFASALCVLQFAFRRLPWHVVGIKKPIPVKGFHRHNLTEYKEYSMTRFLSTYEPIWLYNTTANAGRECEVDEMKMINRLSVILMRSYYENKAKVSAYIQVILQSVTEELMYLSKKMRCAVIRITVVPGLEAAGPEIIYDLRVRNFSLSRGPSNGCKKKFAKLAAKSSRIYEAKCQDILRSKLAQQLTIQGKEVPRNGHLR